MVMQQYRLFVITIKNADDVLDVRPAPAARNPVHYDCADISD